MPREFLGKLSSFEYLRQRGRFRSNMNGGCPISPSPVAISGASSKRSGMECNKCRPLPFLLSRQQAFTVNADTVVLKNGHELILGGEVCPAGL